MFIPVFNPCVFRKKNLSYLLDTISLMKIKFDLYIIEQQTDNKFTEEISKKHSYVNYHNIQLEKKTFSKSKILNKAIDFIHKDYDFFWIHDLDVILNAEYVVDNLDQNFSLIRPYEKIIKLTENESDNLIVNNLVKLEDTRDIESNNAIGKYSFLIKTNLYKDIGGFDERFEGWGFQDLDIINRVPINTNKGYTTNYAFHLYHTTASRSLYNKNKSLYESKINKRKKLILRKTKKKT